MKQIIILILSAISLTAYSQNGIINYGNSLAEPNGSGGARATIHMDKTSRAVLSVPANSETINGFRICVFFDNSQSARESAGSALAALRNSFPKFKAEQTYTNPVWKVFAGEFVTRTEATLALATLKSHFPKAFIVSEKLPIERFAEHISYKDDETPPLDTEPQ